MRHTRGPSPAWRNRTPSPEKCQPSLGLSRRPRVPLERIFVERAPQLSPRDTGRASAHVSAKVRARLRSQSGMLVIEASAGRKQSPDRSGRNSRTRLSLRIIVAPLWMPQLNPRSIEPLVTVPLVLVHPKCAQAKRRKQCLTAWKVTGLKRPCDACEGKFGLVQDYERRAEKASLDDAAKALARSVASAECDELMGSFSQQLSSITSAESRPVRGRGRLPSAGI